MMTIMMMMVSLNANAAKTYVWTDAPEGNLVSTSDAFTATFTATKDDELHISSPEAFASVECEGVTYNFKVVYGTETGAYKYTFDVKAGQVVTIKSDMYMNPGTRVYITQGKITLKESSITPAPGPFTWSGQGAVTVNFNKAVTATKVVLRCPSLQNKEFNCDQAMLGGSNTLSCNITSALNQAYAEGLKAGQPIIVKFEGIKDEDNAQYAGTGTLMITYTAPQQQGTLVSATTDGGKTNLNGEYTFWSFFDPEKEDGLFVFEFSTEIQQIGGGNGSAVLSMGNLDQMAEGRFYNEELPYTIEGKKVIVDARRSKLRSLARMFPSVDFAAEAEGQDERFIIDTEHINLAICNVIDKNGNFIYSPAQGSTGTFSYTFKYKEIEDNISMDGNRPEDMEGQPKQEGSEVQLWIDQELKSVDGVLLYVKVDNNQDVDEEGNQIYGTGQVAISKDDIGIISSDPDEGTVLGFNLPSSLNVTAIDASSSEGETMICSPVVGQPIRLVLQVTTTNGMPHDLVINYGYKKEIATAISEVPALNTQSTAVYNLAGQRVNANTKGIVIINNKKVINK